MITDKDREWTLCFIETLKANGVNMSDFTLEIIDELMKEHRAESADQARKEAAERVACAWREHGEDITLRTIRTAILDDSTTDHNPDTGKKLAIAVKALEKISRKGKASSALDSHFSRLQDSCAFANDALKEIQE